MKDQSTAHVSEVAALLRASNSDALSVDDALELAEAITSTYSGFVRRFDAALYDEIAPIADAISATRRDLARLTATEMDSGRIPEAGRELEAVVKSTEDASNSIMTAAETMLGADRSDADAFGALVDEKVTEILEACAFQDITGQRIAKVVRTLSFIEEHVARLMEQLRAGDYTPAERQETEDEKRARELLLHGPQMDGDGTAQEDIDALFATADVDQDAIDALFK